MKSASLTTILSRDFCGSKSKSIYIPPGFAHGFQGLGKENYIIYSCTNYRNAKSEISIRFDDKNLKIMWPLKKKIISLKDKNAMSLNDFKKNEL